LIFVGQENSGKTSLFRQLQKKSEKSSQGNTQLQKSISTSEDFRTTEFTSKTKNSKNQKVQVNWSCWDFESETNQKRKKEKKKLFFFFVFFVEFFSFLKKKEETSEFGLQSAFFSSRAIYCLVFNLTVPFEKSTEIDRWLQDISVKANKPPVILVGIYFEKKEEKKRKFFIQFFFVGTHRDDSICTSEYLQIYRTKIITKFADNFRNIADYIEVDAKSGRKNFILRNKFFFFKKKNKEQIYLR
jgi:GTPase SAR1 family protein